MFHPELCRAVYLRSIRVYGYAALLLMLVVASILVDLLVGQKAGIYSGMAAFIVTMFSGLFSGNGIAAVTAAVLIYFAVAVFFCFEYLSLVRRARSEHVDEAELRQQMDMVMDSIVPAHLTDAPLQHRINYLARLSLATRLLTGAAVTAACYYFWLVNATFNLITVVPVIVVSFHIALDQISLRLSVLRMLAKQTA